MNNNWKLSPSLSKKGNRELIFISCWKAVLKYRMDTDHQKMLSKQSFELAISWIGPNRQNNIGWQLKLVTVMDAPVAFGEIALMYKTKRTATITAKSHCTIWSLTRSEFNAIMKSINQNNYIDR